MGQSMVHLLSPRHVSREPVSSFTVQVLPPSQATSLLTPVSSVHWLVPAQVEVQSEVQVPVQDERAAQVLVQPVPQVVRHSFCAPQL
jgi:hypothetical protein